jgi:hypothetical protein
MLYSWTLTPFKRLGGCSGTPKLQQLLQRLIIHGFGVPTRQKV